MSDEGECRGVDYDSMRGVECVVEGVQGSGVELRVNRPQWFETRNTVEV